MPTLIRMAVVGVLLAFAAAHAQDDTGTSSAQVQTAAGCGGAERDALPQVQELGSVRYLTGGIGVDEARAMRAERTKYPLAMTFALSYGDRNQFLANVLVEIFDADERPVLCVSTDGPYLFVDLPPGQYRVTATSQGGRDLVRTTRISEGQRSELSFIWPASASAH